MGGGGQGSLDDNDYSPRGGVNIIQYIKIVQFMLPPIHNSPLIMMTLQRVYSADMKKLHSRGPDNREYLLITLPISFPFCQTSVLSLRT